jgi:hypothetical protein
MASSINNPAWLEWMETLMGGAPGRSYAQALPPDRFHCVLDELPLHLVPQRGRRLLGTEAGKGQPLLLNHDCTLCSGRELPAEIKDATLVSGFALEGAIAWVRDPARRMLLPFWLSPRLERIVRDLRPGQPARLSANDAALLASSGVLIGREELPSPFREGLRERRAQFVEKGYASLEDLLHPFHVAALRRYYRHQIRSGVIRLGDGQSPRRYVAYNEPVARFFHQQLANILSEVAREPLKPSYVYLASYLSGAELKKHTDRAQCEFSITLCVDFSPEPDGQTPWPIQVDGAAGTVAIHQALGDGLAYRGTRLPHYRSVLGEGQTSTSIFFHYVSLNFEGPLR